MAVIELPSAAEVVAELVEPSFRHTSALGTEVLVRTGRPYWQGTVRLPVVGDDQLPTIGGPSVQIDDLLRIPLGKDRPAADAGLGPLVTSDEAGYWTLSLPLAEALRKPYDVWFRAGDDGRLVRLEEVLSPNLVRVAPAIHGDGLLYRVTSILAEIIQTPGHRRVPSKIGPWVYQWKEAGADGP